MGAYLVRSAHPRARGYSAPRPRPVEAPAAGRWEAALLEDYRDRRVPLEIVCFDGIVVQGYLRAWERYSLLVETPEGQVIVMKHGVIRIAARALRSGTVGGGRRVVVGPAQDEAPR